MTFRRGFITAGATGVLALTAGCVGFVTGDEPLEFDAGRIVPSDATLEETGYQEQEAQFESFEETVDVGVEREISASVWAATYAKDVEIQGHSEEAALFAAISMPAMDVLGRSFNPLAEMDREELLAEVLGEADAEGVSTDDVRHDETVSVSILGDTRDVDRFITTSEFQGQEIDLVILLAAFEHEGDFLVLLGGCPKQLPDEEVNLEKLLESVEHHA